MSKTFQRVTNIVFAVLLATFSVNLTGVLSLQTAHAAPGNNGALKTHEKGTASGTESNDPHVCDFNFEGFSFDPSQSGLIVVTPQSPSTSGGVSVPFGPTDQTGYAQTAYINDGGSLSLPNGHYKSTLYGKDNQGNYTIDLKAKSKVFWVSCTSVTATAPTSVDKCGTANDTYTIPTTTGVTYYVNSAVKAAGTYAGSGTVTVTAQAKDGYVLTGTTSWTLTFTNVACTITVTTVAPTKANDTCGTANDTYTIPSVTGVDYYVNGVLTTAGTYSTKGAASVTITAQAQTGYTLQGLTSWTLNFDTTPCPVQVTPAAPTKTDLCGKNQDGYTIPTTTGVVYKVNSQTVTAGFHAATGTVTITAVAAPGYVLTGTASWTFTFTNDRCPQPCHSNDDEDFAFMPMTFGNTDRHHDRDDDDHDHDCVPVSVTPAAPTHVDQCGVDQDGYTIPTTTGVVYKVNGHVVTPGFHPATGTVTIVAVAADSGYILQGTKSWMFTFTNVPCTPPPVVVTPSVPTKTDLCGINQDGYTIPTTTGVTYEVNGMPVAAGFYPATGTVTITAVAQKGYVLNEDHADSWTFDFTNVACPCTPSTVTLPVLTVLQTADMTNTDNCTPGQGGGGTPSTPPTTPPVTKTTQVTELPDTGPADGNTALKIATIILAGVATYGAMYVAINRRSLLQK